MITTVIRKVLPLLGVGVILAYIAKRQVPPPPAGDLYFHLRIGREFREGWSLAHPGHLGPFDTADWIPTQWLAQVAMSWMEDLAGLGGVLWATGTLLMVMVALVYWACRREAAALPAALATACCYIAAAPGLSARPQILSYIFVVVFTAAWLATIRDGRPRYWLILVNLVWVPLHGMWPIGIIISATAVLGIALERRTERRQLVRLASIPLGSLAVVLATPIGVGAYQSLLAVGSRSKYFAEWGSPSFTNPFTLASVMMIAVVVVLGLRNGRVSWPHVLLLGLATGWVLYSVRTTPVAALMVAPLLAQSLQRFVPAGDPMRRREWLALGSMIAIAALAMAAIIGTRTDQPVVPSWLDQRLDELPANTRVLNEWDSGAYFLWRHPQLSLVMHGYGDVFTDSEIARNADILRVQPEWDAKVDQLDADYALVTSDSALAYALHKDDWTVVESDDDYELLAPPNG